MRCEVYGCAVCTTALCWMVTCFIQFVIVVEAEYQWLVVLDPADLVCTTQKQNKICNH